MGETGTAELVLAAGAVEKARALAAAVPTLESPKPKWKLERAEWSNSV